MFIVLFCGCLMGSRVEKDWMLQNCSCSFTGILIFSSGVMCQIRGRDGVSDAEDFRNFPPKQLLVD